MNSTINEYIIAGVYLASGIALGLISERIVLQKLKQLTSKTSWKTDDVIINAFHNIILLWWIIVGTYFALHHLGLKEKYLSVADKTLLSATILVATIVSSRILVGLLKVKTEDQTPGATPLPSTSIITNIIRIAVFITGILVILQSLGISITPLLTALGVGGLAVALALQDTLLNLFSGIQVIASRQVKTGDYIRLSSGEEGYVMDITWRNTSIRMLSNNIIVVPNSKIASSILTNFNLPEKEIGIKVDMGISYDSDLEKVERITQDVAQKIIDSIDGTIKESQAIIRFHTFADSGILLSVSFRIKEFSDQFNVKHEFIKALHKRFKEEEIQIPYPTRTVYLKNEEK